MRMVRGIRFTGMAVLVLMGLNLLSGCGIIKKTVHKKSGMTEGESLVRKVAGNLPEWNFMELRVTGKAEEDKNRFAFIATVRMQHNSKIYVVLRSTLGFEVARFFANTDSVWIQSKMFDIKEKGEWKLVAGKLGYPVDYQALQGILAQALFTDSGDQLAGLISGLVVKNETEYAHLVSTGSDEPVLPAGRYLNDFSINRENFQIMGSQIRDVKGQWIANVKYTYNKDNMIRKIDLKGIDSEHSVSVEMNVAKKEIKDYIEINFDKF
jgi:hypothetical protein